MKALSNFMKRKLFVGILATVSVMSLHANVFTITKVSGFPAAMRILSGKRSATFSVKNNSKHDWALKITPPTQQLQLDAGTCSASLAPGASCNFNLNLTPTEVATVNAGPTVCETSGQYCSTPAPDQALNYQVINPVSQALIIDPTTSQTMLTAYTGQIGTGILTVVNTVAKDITITSMNTSNPDFTISDPAQDLTVKAGQSKQFSISYNPKADDTSATDGLSMDKSTITLGTLEGDQTFQLMGRHYNSDAVSAVVSSAKHLSSAVSSLYKASPFGSIDYLSDGNGYLAFGSPSADNWTTVNLFRDGLNDDISGLKIVENAEQQPTHYIVASDNTLWIESAVGSIDHKTTIDDKHSIKGVDATSDATSGDISYVYYDTYDNGNVSVLHAVNVKNGYSDLPIYTAPTGMQLSKFKIMHDAKGNYTGAVIVGEEYSQSEGYQAYLLFLDSSNKLIEKKKLDGGYSISSLQVGFDQQGKFIGAVLGVNGITAAKRSTAKAIKLRKQVPNDSNSFAMLVDQNYADTVITKINDPLTGVYATQDQGGEFKNIIIAAGQSGSASQVSLYDYNIDTKILTQLANSKFDTILALSADSGLGGGVDHLQVSNLSDGGSSSSTESLLQLDGAAKNVLYENKVRVLLVGGGNWYGVAPIRNSSIVSQVIISADELDFTDKDFNIVKSFPLGGGFSEISPMSINANQIAVLYLPPSNLTVVSVYSKDGSQIGKPVELAQLPSGTYESEFKALYDSSGDIKGYVVMLNTNSSSYAQVYDLEGSPVGSGSPVLSEQINYWTATSDADGNLKYLIMGQDVDTAAPKLAIYKWSETDKDFSAWGSSIAIGKPSIVYRPRSHPLVTLNSSYEIASIVVGAVDKTQVITYKTPGVPDTASVATYTNDGLNNVQVLTACYNSGNQLVGYDLLTPMPSSASDPASTLRTFDVSFKELSSSQGALLNLARENGSVYCRVDSTGDRKLFAYGDDNFLNTK